MQTSASIENYFVCVGAQKAGTTWLARVLSSHPDVFVTPVKEIHYFDHINNITTHLSDGKRRSRYRKYHQRLWTQLNRWTELRAQWPWYRRYMHSPIDDTWYTQLFAERQGKTFAGEATPEYAIIGRDGLAHVRRLAPEARVLYIVRNPVTRSWSQLLHYCRVHALDAGDQTDDELIAILRDERFREFGDYATTLANLSAVFSDEQISIEFYEDIHADRLGALERICSFIGTSFEAQWFPGTERRYNPSQKSVLPDTIRRYLKDEYRESVADIAERTSRLPDEWSREFEV